ncbi:MAG TPA: transporter substrate-binding domain-containing protein, partial [Burkholderiales bacterium]|nr:transporter substrate-binding domain-containing protein [Burkholderiales bacterium]
LRDANGQLSGITVDIAQELGKRTGLPITMVPFEAAGKVTAAVKTDAWDVAFLAIDPERAKELTFTAPYVVINGNYVVRKDAPINSIADIDRDGVRIAISRNSAYDLYLSRTLKHAQLFRADNTPKALELFKTSGYEAVAGVKTAMEQFIRKDPGARMIPESFMEIRQAMCNPAGRDAAAAYLSRFVESIKADGFVARAIAQHGVVDASVAPSA